MEKLVLARLTLAILCLSCLGCARAPYTGRSQFIVMSQQEELSLGREAGAQVLRNERLCDDPVLNANLRRVGARIAAVSGLKAAWEFYVIDKDEANAFCLPGGMVFVYSGLFKHMDNDDQLAAVIGHEVAHVLARHAAERASSLQALNIGGLAVGTAVGVAGGSGGFSQIFAQIYGIGVNYGVALPHSRAQEFEADYVGLILMAKAGYSPGAAVSFWEGLRRDFAGQGTPGFLSSHPPSQARIEALLKALPKANSYLPYNQKPAEPLPAPAGPAQAPPGGP